MSNHAIKKYPGDNDLRLFISYLLYYGLNKPWEALHNLIGLNQTKSKNTEIAHAAYRFSQEIQRKMLKNEKERNQSKEAFFRTEEITRFEKDFRIFIELIVVGVTYLNYFWALLASDIPDHNKF